MIEEKEKEAEKEYWKYSKEELLKDFDVGDGGLPEHEVNRRAERFGLNEFGKKEVSTFAIFFNQFKSPLIWVLIIIIVISAVISQYIDAVILFAVILISSMLGFYNEYKSERIMRDLSRQISYNTTVIREGKNREIDFKGVVPGDIVFLSLGDVVPADIRIIEAADLEVNESSVSGESNPVHKTETPIAQEKLSYLDRKNYLFAGSSITNGHCKGIVLYTGANTEFGKLTKELTMAHPQTEFQKGIKKFGSMLIKVIVVLTIIIFFVNSVLNKGLLNSMLFALAVAVGLTPEFLPLVITVSLANGAKKLHKKEVLVKRLVTIEDLGNIEILCSDKTGTLTEGKITLMNYFDADKKINDRILTYSLLCNSAITEKKKVHGRPIDVAILEHAKRTNMEGMEGFSRLSEMPFDYNRKRMSVIAANKKQTMLITKGSPESILSISTHMLKNDKVVPISGHAKKLREEFVKLAGEGYIVIAVGYKAVKKQKEYGIKDEHSVILSGYMVFFDPPKKTAKETLFKLKNIGVDLKILTGDNDIITKKVCDDLGIPVNKIMLGSEMDGMSDERLKEVVMETDIFAKLTPMQKVRVIKTLREKGKVVGYLGDGVNDAAALHEADVGISVDSAVDIAKDSADLLLLRKSLSIIHEGILEGRRIFGNTIKYIFMETSSNFGNMISVAGASFFLPFLPLLPIQILLNNLLYDISQLSLSSDNVDEEYLKKPKRWNIKMIKEYMLWFGPISSVYDFLTFGIMIYVLSFPIPLFRTGWFIESLFTQTLVVFAIRTKKIPFFRSRPSNQLIAGCLAVLVVGLIIPFSPLAKFLGFVKVPWLFFFFLMIMVLTYLLVVEFFKGIFFRKYEL